MRALETGWFQRKIAESAARQQWEIEQHRRVIVGVNEFVVENDELTIPLLKIGEHGARAARAPRQAARRRATTRSSRDGSMRSRRPRARTENLVPHILDCARAYCTLYEIRAAMEEVFGAYREPVFF